MIERRQPSGHPDISPLRNVLFFLVLISSALAQTFQQQQQHFLQQRQLHQQQQLNHQQQQLHNQQQQLNFQQQQQYPGIRQSWIQIPFYPTNSVYQLRQVAAPTSGIGAAGSPSQLLLHENNVRDPSKAKVISREESEEEYVDDDYEADLESEQDPRSTRVLQDYGNVKRNQEKQTSNHTAHLPPNNKNSGKSNTTHQANQHEDPASTQYDSYYYYDDYENDTHSADGNIDYPDPLPIDEKKLQFSETGKSNLDSEKEDSEAISVEIKSTSRNESEAEDSRISKTESSRESLSSSKISLPKSDETSPKVSESLESQEKEDESDYFEHPEADSGSLDEGFSAETKEENSTTKAPPSEESSSSKSILIGEAVVSVVTTKSVVNGTFSVPVTLSPLTTEQLSAPPTTSPSSLLSSTESPSSKSAEDLSQVTTEDSSRILASVQTSRSISGARFLPFPVIDRVEQFDQSKEEATSKKASSSESTESIIDKLDRVQSELSNGFLAGGFRTAGNTLQMDEPAEGERPNQKRFSTIKPPGKFVPRRYNDKRTSTTPATTPTTVTTTTVKSTTLKASTSRFRYQTTLDDLEGLLPKNYPKSSLRRQFPKTTTTSIPVTEATTAKSTTAASKSATILQDISAFLPPGYKAKQEEATEKSLLAEILAKSNVKIASFLSPGYNSNSTESSGASSTEKSSDNSKEKPSISIQDLFAKSEVDISAYLPRDFKEKKNSTETQNTQQQTTDKKPLQDLFAKSAVDASAFLPKDYKERSKNVTKENADKVSPSTNKSIQDLFAKSEVDLSAFLPKDFTSKKNGTEKGGKGEEKTAISDVTPTSTTMKTAGVKLVFPSRPGGRKPSAKITTPQTPKGEGPSASVPKIQKGWPIRATTEFTGWPTSSTTPISIEKLLEVAQTATDPSLNISQIPTISEVSSTSTTTTTTTTTTLRPTTPGICEDECEVAGTIRIIDNATWVPELLDRNTREWQDLANKVEREMNFVFAKSAVFKKWFKNIRIDAFSQGSILVDYFVELNNLPEGVNTQQLKVIFHDSLRTYNNPINETKTRGPLKMGTFTIDPKFTDFVVIPKLLTPLLTEHEEKLIPQWAIAVIIIGIGGLLFIIVFGVSMLMNRQSVPKLRPPVMTIYDEEATKNVIHATHAPPMQRSSDYHKADIHTMWNDPGPAWNDKSFESTSNKILVDGSMQESKKYNMYDSWRSEWNGYYYNHPSHTSSKYGGYDSSTNLSRHHHPDYDTNF